MVQNEQSAIDKCLDYLTNVWLKSSKYTPDSDNPRNSRSHRLWRNFLLLRYKYVCQECGKRTLDIHAHHIKSFEDNIDLRFRVRNGTLLCIDCHQKKHPMLVISDRRELSAPYEQPL